MLAALAAAAALAGSPACRTNEVRQHDEIVYGHFATAAAARPLRRRLAKTGFRGVKLENDGCGDYELEQDGADTQQQRSSVAGEAAKAGFQVTFEQTGDPLAPAANQTYGLFGSLSTVPAADALARRAALTGFRYVDVVPSGRRWLVVMPQVPVRSALTIAHEAARAGLHVRFRRS